MNDNSDFLACTWNCVHFYENYQFSRIKNKFNGETIKAYWIDVENVNCDLDLFSLFSSSMIFADYFGKNWDAFDECLSDLDINNGCVCILYGASHLWKNAPYTGGKLVSAWQTAAERNSYEKIPFHLIFVL